MRLDFLTLFPDMFAGPLTESIVARARKQGLVDIRLIDLREFTHDQRRTVDDTPYGGGAGMVLKPEPLFEAVAAVRTPDTHVVLLSPQGQPFRQRMAERLARQAHIVFVCGQYEGVDERVRQSLVDEEISLGDFVLTNGNLAAMVVADAVIRLLPGALGSAESALSESFVADGWLEYPHYTRPETFAGMCVPEVLLSGHHGQVDAWRRQQRLTRTLCRRPDLVVAAVEETEHEPSSGKD